VKGVVEAPRQDIGRKVSIARGKKIRAAHVTDEQRVACQHTERDLVAAMFVHNDADRFRGVPRCGEDLEGDLAQGQPLPVMQGFDRKADVGTSSVGDDRAGPSRKLEMTPDEVGVDVSLDDPFDGQPLGPGFVEVNVDVAARIYDHGSTGGLVSHQVGRVGQATQVMLRQDHGLIRPRRGAPRRLTGLGHDPDVRLGLFPATEHLLGLIVGH
jgi:hypothetical protein